MRELDAAVDDLFGYGVAIAAIGSLAGYWLGQIPWVKTNFERVVMGGAFRSDGRVERGTGLVQDTTPAERAMFQTERMTLALELSEAQQSGVYAINMNTAARMEAIVLSGASSSRIAAAASI